MYHAVGTQALGDENGLFTIAPERFRRHAEVLASGRDGAVAGLEQGLGYTADRTVAITFDDGYLDNLRVAAPLLIRLGLPFTVFVTSSFVAQQRPGFLARSDLFELASLPGVTIGAHGANHVPLTRCSDLELQAELTTSKRYLEEAIGREVGAIAYPYGEVDRRVRDAAVRAGYRTGVCSHFGLNANGRDAMLLKRNVILASDSERVLRQKLRGDWDWYGMRTRDPAQ
jgi:peptidoglycan/xylan/chitin deacetylase (PgdA/CDA1 family)